MKMFSKSNKILMTPQKWIFQKTRLIFWNQSKFSFPLLCHLPPFHLIWPTEGNFTHDSSPQKHLKSPDFAFRRFSIAFRVRRQGQMLLLLLRRVFCVAMRAFCCPSWRPISPRLAFPHSRRPSFRATAWPQPSNQLPGHLATRAQINWPTGGQFNNSH